MRVHPGLDEFDGDQTLYRLALLGQPNASHAPFAGIPSSSLYRLAMTTPTNDEVRPGEAAAAGSTDPVTLTDEWASARASESRSNSKPNAASRPGVSLLPIRESTNLLRTNGEAPVPIGSGREF